MEFKRLGNTKQKLPEIGIGTWKMGSNPEREIEALKKAISLGMPFIDTAEMYGSEGIVGSAIKGAGKVFVATKVSPNHFTREGIIKSCNQSLENLGVRQIDLYQLHWPNHSIPIKETMSAMEQLANEGKIKYIGISNFDVKEMAEAQAAMKDHDIVSNQVEYSVIMRDIENGLLEFCNDNNVSIIAYSPLGQGSLYSSKFKSVLDLLERIGRPHGKSATQVALNWLVSKKGVFAIPKTSNPNHIKEIFESSGWELSGAEMAELDAIKQRKGAIGGFMYPVLKNTAIWASAMELFRSGKQKKDHKSSTAKSSKK